MLHLSYEKIITFNQCPYRYKCLMDGQNVSSYALLKKTFSHMVEEYYRCMVRSKNKDCNPVDKMDFTGLDEKDILTLKQSAKNLVLNEIDIAKISTVGFYFTCHIPATDVALNGKFDLVECDDKRKIVKLIKYQINQPIRIDPIWQSIYSYALAKTHPLSKIYYLQEWFMPENKVLKMSFISKEQALKDIKRYIEPILGNNFSPRPGEHCFRCQAECDEKKS